MGQNRRRNWIADGLLSGILTLAVIPGTCDPNLTDPLALLDQEAGKFTHRASDEDPPGGSGGGEPPGGN